jgi:hypothetical protein
MVIIEENGNLASVITKEAGIPDSRKIDWYRPRSGGAAR